MRALLRTILCSSVIAGPVIGCVSWDVSTESKYGRLIGTPMYLNRAQSVWDRGFVLPSYELNNYTGGDTYNGYIKVAELPAGTPVEVVKVQRIKPLIRLLAPPGWYFDRATFRFSLPDRKRLVTGYRDLWDERALDKTLRWKADEPPLSDEDVLRWIQRLDPTAKSGQKPNVSDEALRRWINWMRDELEPKTLITEERF